MLPGVYSKVGPERKVLPEYKSLKKTLKHLLKENNEFYKLNSQLNAEMFMANDENLYLLIIFLPKLLKFGEKLVG